MNDSLDAAELLPLEDGFGELVGLLLFEFVEEKPAEFADIRLNETSLKVSASLLQKFQLLCIEHNIFANDHFATKRVIQSICF